MALHQQVIALHDGCVRGSVHQQSAWFTGPGKGLQCVANAICYILHHMHKRVNSWTTADIDAVLIRGHNLYMDINKIRRLLPSDLPPHITMNNIDYVVKEMSSFSGSFTAPNAEFQIKTLDMLHNVMCLHKHFILCIADSAVSIIRDFNYNYYICDSHSRNVYGFPTSDGAAISLKFNTFARMVHYLKAIGRCFNSDQFELTVMDVSILSDVRNQNTPQNVTTSHERRRTYMREYMRARRNNEPDFREKENEAKRQKRQQQNKKENSRSKPIHQSGTVATGNTTEHTIIKQRCVQQYKGTKKQQIETSNNCERERKRQRDERSFVDPEVKQKRCRVDTTHTVGCKLYTTSEPKENRKQPSSVRHNIKTREKDELSLQPNPAIQVRDNSDKFTLHKNNVNTIVGHQMCDTNEGTIINLKEHIEQHPENSAYLKKNQKKETTQPETQHEGNVKKSQTLSDMSKTKEQNILLGKRKCTRKTQLPKCDTKKLKKMKYSDSVMQDKETIGKEEQIRTRKSNIKKLQEKGQTDRVIQDKRTTGKKEQIQNPKYEKELKKKRCSDSVIQDKRTTGKTEQRQNRKYEKKLKKTAHGDLVIESKPPTGKKEQTLNPKYDKELKKKIYSDLVIQDKETTAKKEQRQKRKCDTTDRKKTTYTDSVILDKETTANKQQRKNSKCDTKKLKNIRYSDPVIQHKEKSRKKEQRQNPQFKLREEQKRLIRTDRPELKHAKARAMQQRRENSAYVENEAIHKKHGRNFQESINIFHNKIKHGCIFVCSVCHQTNFEDNVVLVENLKASTHTELLHECLTGYKSHNDREYLCLACKRAIYKGTIPKLSLINKCGFPERHPDLDLHSLEEVLISPIIPFMTIRELPVGGQKSIKGNICHIPVDVSPTINSLPRNLDETQTVSVKMKRKKSFKNCVLSENIRPHKVVKALHYLMETSDIFQQQDIQVNEDWISKLQETDRPETCYLESANCSTSEKKEITEDELDSITNERNEIESQSESEEEPNAPCTATLLDDQHIDVHSMSLVYAPGEGKKPIYNEPNAEYLCFPTIFCGQRRPSNEERTIPVRDTELFKYELCNVDTRVASHIPNIFWKAKHKQARHLVGKVSLAVRRNKTKGKTITAGTLLNKEEREKIVKLDEGYLIFRTLRNSPPYYDSKKKDVMAMVRQLGIPTLFYSLSAADTRWNQLLVCLAKIVDQKNYTELEVEELPWTEKCRLISKNPGACARYFHHRVQKFETHILKSPYSPFGQLQYNFYRVEFQHRGSPHIHGLLWIKGAPKFDIQNDEEVCTYIDSVISCTSDVDANDVRYLQLQKHRHSKTCQKIIRGIKTCRFGAPWPPMKHTMILRPIEDKVEEEIEKYKEIYANILEKLNKIQAEDMNITFEDFLHQLDITEAVYILALRSTLKKPKIYLKRHVCDIYINSYMKGMLSVWQANHDFQFVLDAFSCVVYICDYMTKSSKGMSELLATACDEAKQGNMNLKQSVRHMGNKFLNCVEISAQECCYDLLELPFTRSNLKTEFISTCPPDDRVFIAKDDNILQDMDPNSEDIKKAGNIERYAKRPQQLNEWCLADFVAYLDIRYKSKNSIQDDIHVSDDDNISSDAENSPEHVKHVVFPMKLSAGKLLVKRKEKKVIRFVGYKYKLDPENYCRERLLLYTPWRSEETDLYCGQSSYVDAYQMHKATIEQKMKVYEPLATQLDDAVEMLQEEIEADLAHIAPSTQHAEENDEQTPATTSNSLEFYDPDRPSYQRLGDIGPMLNLPPPPFENCIEMIQNKMSDEQFHKHLQSLNKQQQEFFTHVMTLQSRGDEQVLCCLTGGAGTGKSHVLKALVQALYRAISTEPGQNRDNNNVLVTAPTGKAAYNVKGSTIHGAFYVPANQSIRQYKPLTYDMLNTLRVKYSNLKWLLIDEISMVSNDMLKLINLRLQHIMDNKQPFGGVNVIAIGDFFQLQPVKGEFIFVDITYDYGALAPNLWTDYFTVYELTEIMRQKDDKTFAELLNRLRIAEHTEDDLTTLKTRIVHHEELKSLTDIPHFFPTRDQVQAHNDFILQSSDEDQIAVTAIDIMPEGISEDFRDQLHNAVSKRKPEHTGGLPKDIKLALHHQYDLICNIAVEDGMMNGAQCCVKHIEFHKNPLFPAIVWVQFEDVHIGTNHRNKYSYLYSKGKVEKAWTPIFAHKRSFLVKNQWISRVQFPLRQAAARTIHVSQSATYEQIYIDMLTRKNPPKHFWHHMHYVALSRVTSLSGLHIGNLNETKIGISPKVSHYMEDVKEKHKLQLSYRPLYQFSPETFKIVYNNTRSLKRHYNDVKCCCAIQGADIIILAETRLSLTDKTDNYNLDGYNTFRVDDLNVTNPHHGLMLYVKEDIYIKDIKKYPGRKVEAIHVRLESSGVATNIIGVYISPTTCREDLHTFLNSMIQSIKDERLTVIGDFNINASTRTNTSFIQDMKTAHNLTQYMENVTTKYNTIIDLVFSNHTQETTSTIYCYWSDHSIIYTVTNETHTSPVIANVKSPYRRRSQATEFQCANCLKKFATNKNLKTHHKNSRCKTVKRKL